MGLGEKLYVDLDVLRLTLKTSYCAHVGDCFNSELKELFANKKDADKHNNCKHHLIKSDAGNGFTTKDADTHNCEHHLVKTDAGNLRQLLRREIDAALLDRDRTIKEAHELREKLGIQSDVWIFIKL